MCKTAKFWTKNLYFSINRNSFQSGGIDNESKSWKGTPKVMFSFQKWFYIKLKNLAYSIFFRISMKQLIILEGYCRQPFPAVFLIMRYTVRVLCDISMPTPEDLVARLQPFWKLRQCKTEVWPLDFAQSLQTDSFH